MIAKLTRRTALAMALTFAAVPAMAAESVKAVVIDGYPAGALWVKEFTNFFIPAVDERLAKSGNYVMEWQESYGGSIVKPKGVLEGIQLGLGDIGIVTTIFHNSKLPSQAISAVTPFVAADARAVAKAVDEIAKEFPTMQNEFAAQNQVYLATGVVLDTYQLFSKNPINSLADVEGGKVAGAGMNLRYLEGIEGAAGVRGGLTDFYNMLQTGLVDHAMLWPEGRQDLQDRRCRAIHAPCRHRRGELQDHHGEQGLLGWPAGRGSGCAERGGRALPRPRGRHRHGPCRRKQGRICRCRRHNRGDGPGRTRGLGQSDP